MDCVRQARGRVAPGLSMGWLRHGALTGEGAGAPGGVQVCWAQKAGQRWQRKGLCVGHRNCHLLAVFLTGGSQVTVLWGPPETPQ